MFNYIYNLYNIINNSNIDTWLLYSVYSVTFILLGFIIFFIVLVGSKLFNTSNYTIRKLLLLKYNYFKKTNTKKYFLIINKSNYLFKRIYYNNKLALERSGLYSKKVLFFIIILKWLLIPLISILVYFLNNQVEGKNELIRGVMTLVFFESVVIGLIRYYIKKESDKFKIISYKLFKFLRNQLSSGIKITQALNSLHTVTKDSLLKNRLLLMASHYASTNDIDEALKYITNYYKTLEAKSLALSIKQSIETGKNDNGFKQKEKKLFNLYINVIKKNTQLIMFKYFIIGILYGLVIVLIISYPQWLDLLEANKIIFGR